MVLRATGIARLAAVDGRTDSDYAPGTTASSAPRRSHERPERTMPGSTGAPGSVRCARRLPVQGLEQTPAAVARRGRAAADHVGPHVDAGEAERGEDHAQIVTRGRLDAWEIIVLPAVRAGARAAERRAAARTSALIELELEKRRALEAARGR